uniref:Uncharacterized protein n=1 Tax=Arundo donax TaxID=35708 RepID=A0A0A9B7Y9_ARUDO
MYTLFLFFTSMSHLNEK